MTTEKINREQAENEFERMADAMRLDLDPEGIDENERRDMEGDRRTFVKAIVRGDLVLDDDLRPVFTPEGGDPLTFYPPKGSSLMAADKKKEGHDVAKTYAILGELTRAPAVTFSKMDFPDLKVCVAVMGLFFAQ